MKYLLSLLLLSVATQAFAGLDPLTLPASPISMNTFNLTLQHEKGIVDTVYANQEFVARMNQLRQEVGPNRAIVILGYLATMTPQLASLQLKLGVFEVEVGTQEFGDLVVKINRAGNLKVFDLNRIK